MSKVNNVRALLKFINAKQKRFFIKRHQTSLIKKLYSAFGKAIKLKKKSGHRIYEPLKIANRYYEGTREWELRWEAIKKTIQFYKANNIIDIGCAEGWFVRRAAEELNCFSIGVEADDLMVWPSETARLHDKVERCSIMKSFLETNDIKKLPKFDIVICLSVVHHIIRSSGLEAGKEFVRQLSGIAQKALVFEMGTVEEIEWEGAKDMPEMPEGQHQFIKTFLEDAGLKNVREVARTRSLKSDEQRILFSGESSL